VSRATAVSCCLATFLIASAASAQSPTLAPRPAEAAPAPFRFPAVTTRTLPNGLRLVVSENHAVPVVAVRLETGADSTLDPVGQHGLADVVAQALGQASTHFSPEALSDTLAALGVVFRDTLFTTRTANFRSVLGIMADLVMHPVFADASVQSAKAAVTQARRAIDNSTIPRAREVMYDALFGAAQHLNNRPSAASIASITTADVAGFHSAWYRPSRMTLILVGDITPAEAEREATLAFGAWRPAGAAGTTAAVADTERGTQHPTTIYLVDRPGAKQSTIVFGGVGPALTASDYAPVAALDATFGATASSRLTQALRQQHAWAYTAASHMDLHRANEPMVLWAATDVAPAATDSSIVAALATLRASGSAIVYDEATLRSANAIVVGSVQRLIATDDALAARLKGLVEAGLPMDYYVTVAGQMDRLTPARIVEAAERYDNPDRLVIVVVGDRATIEAPVRALGFPVTLVPRTGP